VPGTPDFIEGIMNLRGDYITVINLKKFLSLPENLVSEKKPVIIIKCNELKLALLIDKINELFEYQETAQDEYSDSYYANEFIYNKMLYTVLNIDKISSDKRIIITDM
jgi:purine-binding chemotaxis protein CheW